MAKKKFKEHLLFLGSMACLIGGLDIILDDYQDNLEERNQYVGNLSYLGIDSTELKKESINIEEIQTDEEEMMKLKEYINELYKND